MSIRRSSKPKPPKKLVYAFIAKASPEGRPIYALLEQLVAAHHTELLDARFALAWNLSWKPDVDGRVTLGKCKKASDLDRELAAFDFAILLRQEFWTHSSVTDVQRRALLDHELMHAAVKYDENGEPATDARGRTIYRIRKHDLEEFSEIAERYGCWKRDIEAFAAALAKAERHAEAWVGYTSLRETLLAAGADVPLERIVTWSEAERREARTWALVRQDVPTTRQVSALDPGMPACLAAALAAAAPPPEPSAAATH